MAALDRVKRGRVSHFRSDFVYGLLLIATLALLVLIGPLPALWALSDVFHAPREALAALLNARLWERLLTTLGIAAGAMSIALLIGLPQAWLLSRSDLPARRLLTMLLPLPLFLPPLAHIVSWFGALRLTGIPAIILVYAISFTPFITLLAMRSLEAISREYADTLRLIGGRWVLLRDELRQALPGALIGCALMLTFILSDFAAADFLTSVGPKVTVYSDALYAHHLALRPAGAAAAALPGMVICMALLTWALKMRRQLGVAVGARFEPAPSVELGCWRWAAFAGTAAPIVMGSVFPLLALLWQTGSVQVILEQARLASDRIVFTLQSGAFAATGMVALGLPLAALAARMRKAWRLDALVFLSLAIPALLYGIGLIRIWNRPGLDAVYLGMGVVILAMMGRYLAFAYLPLSGAIERIDPALREAAQLAGAGSLTRTLYILAPLLATQVAAAWCVSFCFTLRELDTLIMLRAGQNSLTFHLYSNVVFARQDETAALALILAVVTYAPLLIYLALTRRSLRFL